MATAPIPLAHTTVCNNRVSIHVCFEGIQDFQRDFAHNLKLGAIFLGTEQEFCAGNIVNVVLNLDFGGAAVSIVGEVVSVITPALAKAGGTAPGISIRLADHPLALVKRLERLSGISLEASLADSTHENEVQTAKADVPTKESSTPTAQQQMAAATEHKKALAPAQDDDDRRIFPREASHASVELETPHGTFPGQAANISYSGVLAMIEGISIPLQTKVRVRLADPSVELALLLDGKVVRQTICDNGVMAHGIQLLYPADRIDEVQSFIDFLQGFDHARKLGTIAGRLDNGDLRTILELFVETAPFGTLTVLHNNEEGKITFSENKILYAMIGLVSGMKALSRMLSWKTGRFEFHPSVDLRETGEPPLAIDQAMLIAAVQLDELANMDLSSFNLTGTLSVNLKQLAVCKDQLNPVEKEVAGYAAAGFTLDAVLDVIPDMDVDIYRALIGLRERGVLPPTM